MRGGSRGGVRAPSAGDWRAEVELLQRAERALRSQQDELALSFLEDCEARYPRSALREEREAIGVMASCQASPEDAEKRAREFVRVHPASVYLGRVEKACGLRAAEPAADSL